MTRNNRHLSFESLSGKDVSTRKELFDAILKLDRSNMESIMRSSNFDDFPWDKRIKGLADEDTVLFVAFSPGEVAGYLELHPNRLGNGSVYISSLQISPEHRGGLIFSKLLKFALEWFHGQPHHRATTEVQVSNARMISILRRMGFEFDDGKHAHTKHAGISRESLSGNGILNRIRDEGRSDVRSPP